VVTCSRRDYDSPPAAEGVDDDASKRVVHMTCDVREPDQIDAVVQRALDEFGRVDVLVNNAGGSPAADASTASPRFFAAIIAINLTGLMVFSQRANNVMQKQDEGGSIVNISSVAGLSATPSTHRPPATHRRCSPECRAVRTHRPRAGRRRRSDRAPAHRTSCGRRAWRRDRRGLRPPAASRNPGGST
jgi:NAD(P)-dependent dehydrogenase (short-subunit alcohol dehydrogenase family)